jgi:hypothetical protein
MTQLLYIATMRTSYLLLFENLIVLSKMSAA